MDTPFLNLFDKCMANWRQNMHGKLTRKQETAKDGMAGLQTATNFKKIDREQA